MKRGMNSREDIFEGSPGPRVRGDSRPFIFIFSHVLEWVSPLRETAEGWLGGALCARKLSKECRLLEVVGMLRMLLVIEAAPKPADIFTFGSSR